ncbi:hypothetical protein ACIQ8D_34390 [Streptomyces sp. NPDC096094]|uniref:hypothetical protein n=1 Tax=Streptomyces sp. NPDC096094 TaxID=3366073 RepID=UPI003815ACBA
MEATESTGRDGGRTTAGGADPLTLRLLRLVAADGAPMDSITAMEVLSAWHRRGVEVGFPELMARPASGRRRPSCSCQREHRTS